MAIDTQDKRRSAANAILHLTMPTANSDIDTSDRATVAWLYGGIAETTEKRVMMQPNLGMLVPVDVA